MPIRAAELSVLVGADISGAEKGFAKVTNGLRQLGGEGSSFSGVFGGMFAANLFSQAVGQIGNLGREAIGAYAGYERLGMSLQSLAAKELLAQGSATSMAQALQLSAGRAKELQAWTQKLAIQSPFTQQGVADAFRTSLAYGFTTKEAQRLTQAMIDFSAGSGATEATMSRVALALGQIRTRGKLAGQEVMQLTEAGISVDTILAKAFGKTTNEIVSMREKGLIPAQQAIDAIQASLEEGFGGAALRQSGTFAGLLSSLEDIKQIGLREFFGETFRAIQPELQKFVDLLQKPETIKWLQDGGKKFAAAILDIGEAAGDAAKWFGDLEDSTQNAVIALGGFILLRKPIFELLANGATLAGGFMKALGTGRDILLAWRLGMTATQGGLVTMGVTLGAIGAVVVAVAAVWYQWNEQISKTNKAGLTQTQNQWDDFFEKQRTGGKTLTQTVQDFKNAYGGINQTIKDGGFAGLFMDKKGLALQGLKEMEAAARTGAKGYQEYAAAVMEAAKATGMVSGGYQFGKGASMEDAAAYQFLTQQVGLLNEQQYAQALGTQQVRAQQDLYTYSMMQYNAAAQGTILTQEQMITQKAAQAQAEAEFQQQLSNAQGLYEGYKAAIGQVQQAEQNWMSQTGGELVDYLSKKVPEGSEKWKAAMGLIDETYGTTGLKAWETQKATENLFTVYQRTGDMETLKAGLVKLRDDGLETVRKGLEDVIQKAKDFYYQLLALPEKIRIQIEFSAQSPQWILNNATGETTTTRRYGGEAEATGETTTTRRYGGEAEALGGPVYPGRTYLVGEEGPEPFRPFTAGYVERSNKPGRKDPVILQANITSSIDVEELLYRMMQRLQEQLA